jgi:predicted metalloenzyme YecM
MLYRVGHSMDPQQFYDEAQRFLLHCETQWKERGLVIEPRWLIDHLCYRVTTEELYTTRKDEFEQFGILLVESMVNGRLIATYKLHKPIVFKTWRIPLVELPAPKAGKPFATGFEHIEVVCDASTKEHEVEMDGCAIKFHHRTLEDIIAEELATQVN